MQVTELLKQHISEAIKADLSRKNGMTQSRHANYLGISASIYSRLMKGETDRVLSEGEWVRIGMKLGANMDGLNWQTAQTATLSLISTQLEVCKERSLSAIFCDEKGIGKTHSAKLFAQKNVNVAYVDCSQAKTKRDMIRAIAREFGFSWNTKLGEVRQNLVDNILTLDKPLLILDEAGDLQYDAWLELKSIWNALENMCGFYMLGANGLKVKIDRQINNRKVGYEEIFDRYGDRYQSVLASLSEGERAACKRHQAESVLRQNLPNLTKEQAAEILNACGLNLRRLRIEIIKYKSAAQA